MLLIHQNLRECVEIIGLTFFPADEEDEEEEERSILQTEIMFLDTSTVAQSRVETVEMKLISWAYHNKNNNSLLTIIYVIKRKLS